MGFAPHATLKSTSEPNTFAVCCTITQNLSPTAGVEARAGSNIITGKSREASSIIFWQIPLARAVRRFGGRLLVFQEAGQ